jgi:hypothetical protein
MGAIYFMDNKINALFPTRYFVGNQKTKVMKKKKGRMNPK